MARTEDAGEVLSDLKVTNCPACDQTVSSTKQDPEHCFLCHQTLLDEPVIPELGSMRLRFERERIIAELDEADDLQKLLKTEAQKLADQITCTEEVIREIDTELAPAREAVASLAQGELSAIDMALGQVGERERQIGRIATAFEVGEDLTRQIEKIDIELQPLKVKLDEILGAIDFGTAAGLIEDGMNEYLDFINRLRPGVWRHSPVKLDLSKSTFAFRLGSRRWHGALGGTDTLYFLMAYNYGLLTLSNKSRCHYPGFSMIDLPGEFAGER